MPRCPHVPPHGKHAVGMGSPPDFQACAGPGPPAASAVAIGPKDRPRSPLPPPHPAPPRAAQDRGRRLRTPPGLQRPGGPSGSHSPRPACERSRRANRSSGLPGPWTALLQVQPQPEGKFLTTPWKPPVPSLLDCCRMSSPKKLFYISNGRLKTKVDCITGDLTDGF